MSIFRPDLLIDSIYDIPLADLSSRGINHILFDVDNTIVPYNDTRVPESAVKWFHETTAKGFRTSILSNNHAPRLKPVADILGIEFIEEAKKPLHKGAKEAVERFGVPADKIALVGDQLLTDMLCGNTAGFYTICVKPINPDEWWYTKWHRNYEKLLYKLMGIKR